MNKMSRTSKKNLTKVFILNLAFLGAFLMLETTGYATGFPQVAVQSDEDDMIREYKRYLHFVVEIGKEVDAKKTGQLVRTYQALQKRNSRAAAIFLRGLRYEMVQRIELTNQNPARLTTNSPEMRKFVAKFLGTWLREADEHLFRTYSTEIARRE